MRRNCFALPSVFLALFAVDSMGSLVMRGELGGSLANAQTLGEPADESTDADVTAQPAAVNNIAGTWSGPVSTSAFGDGTLTETITQKANATQVKGTWSLMFNARAAGGKIKGIENNGMGMVDLKSKGGHHCIVQTAVTIPDATHMNGTLMTTAGCNNPSTGNFMLTKQ